MALDGWRTVTLGEVAELDIERVAVQADAEYSIVGVLNAGQGLFWRERIAGRDTSYVVLHRLRAGQLVYRKLTAWEGPITVVPQEFEDGFVSSEFPTFTLDESQLLHDFMRVICLRPVFWAQMRMRGTGTAERRTRLKPGELLAIPIELPPLDEQRQTASVVAVIDDAVQSYANEGAAALTLLAAAREDAFERFEPRRLGDLVLDIEAGKSPKALDRLPTAGERGVLKVSAIRAGEFRPSEAKAVAGGISFPPRAAVKRGDVLISRANTRELVGVACRVDVDCKGLYLSDKTLRLVIDEESVDPGFIVHALSSSAVREQIEEAASGTSDSMKNISQKAIVDLDVPVASSLEEQRDLGRTLDALRDAARDAYRLRERALALRVRAVESLLSGELSARRVATDAAELVA